MPSIQGASAYRQAAAEGATQIGLLMIAYDSLARELSRAAAAVQRNDVPTRCRHSSLALTILGHLESWIGYLDDPALAASLEQFYGFLRGRILQLQAQGNREGFDSLAKQVMDTRATWQQKENQLLTTFAKDRSEGRGSGVTANRVSGTSSFSCSG